jgi:hypothetical protein
LELVLAPHFSIDAGDQQKVPRFLKLFSFLFSALAVVYFIGFVMHLQDKQSGSAGNIFL